MMNKTLEAILRPVRAFGLAAALGAAAQSGCATTATMYSYRNFDINQDGTMDLIDDSFTHDDQGRISEWKSVEKESSGTREYLYRNFYDTQGRLEREERCFDGFNKPLGVIKYDYSEDGRAVTQTNLWGKEKVWVSKMEKDEHGNDAKFTFVSYKGSKKDRTDTTTYENVYG